MRYNVVRWMVQPGQGYAVGPSRTNPFTGEIFDADIRISADFVRYAHLEFTELVDPVGREALGWRGLHRAFARRGYGTQQGILRYGRRAEAGGRFRVALAGSAGLRPAEAKWTKRSSSAS